MGDQQMRELVDAIPVPDYDGTPWTAPPDLTTARVAIVTTAGLRLPEHDAFSALDQTFRVLPRDRRDLVLSHFSPNFDRVGVMSDLDVVYPIHRLEEMAADGAIGSVADQHLAFMGAQDETMSTIRLDTGPAAATELKDHDVDVVLLTPV